MPRTPPPSAAAPPSSAPAEHGEAPLVVQTAFTCQPGLGSEYEVGWRWSEAVPGSWRAIILTRLACWRAIEGERTTTWGLPAKRIGNRTYVGVAVPWADRRLRGRTLMRTHYAHWQTRVARLVQKHRAEISLVHHVTFVSSWWPPKIARCGVPYVWGPLGTNRDLPNWYARQTGLLTRLRLVGRHLLTQTRPRLDPRHRRAVRGAQRVFAVHPFVPETFHPSVRDKVGIHPAIAVEAEWIADASEVPRWSERRPAIVFVGRFIDSKLPNLVLAALAKVRSERPDIACAMIGEALLPRIGTQARAAGVEVRDTIPRSEVRALFDEARVLLFPSWELSGFVTLEAMGRGLPVVTLEGGGPAAFLRDGGGVVCMDLQSLTRNATSLADACIRLVDDAAQWSDASGAGLRSVHRHTWEHLPRFLEATYSNALGRTIWQQSEGVATETTGPLGDRQHHA